MAYNTLKSHTALIAGLAIAGLLLAYFLVFPTWQKYSGNSQELSRLQEQNRSLLKAESDLQIFVNKYQSLSAQVALVNAALPLHNPGTAALLGSLEGLAKLSGLTLSSINVTANTDKVKAAPVYALVPVEFNISASGSYAAFKDYILRLENHLRLVDLESISLRVENDNLVNYQLKLIVYYQK